MSETNRVVCSQCQKLITVCQKEDVYTLSTGDVVLRWPERITAEEADDLDDWLEIMRRKLKGSVSAIEDEVYFDPERVATMCL